MAVVYSDSPAGAFAASSNLDQQRVQNFLASLAQNQQTQLRGYDAAVNQAAARQASQERQENNALQVAQYIAKARQNREAETYGRQQDALALMLQNKKFDRDSKYQDFLMSQETPLVKQAAARAAKDAEDQAKDDAALAQMLPMLNEKRRMDALSAMLTKQNLGKLTKEATGSGFEPPQTSFGRAAALSKLAFWNPNRSTLAKENEVKDRLASASFDLPVAPDESERLAAYVKRLEEGLVTKRAATAGIVPDASRVAGMVEVDAEGRLVPLRRNPLLTAGTGTTAPAPISERSVGTTDQPSLSAATGIREDFRNGRISRDRALQALRTLGFQ